jgi:hypothetical protein
MGDDLVFVFEFHPEHGVREQFCDHTRKLEDFFLRHSLPLLGLWRPDGWPGELRGTYMIMVAL